MTTRKKGKDKAPSKAKRKGPAKARGESKGARKKTPGKPPVYAHVFDNPLNVKRALYVLFAVCIVTFGLDFFVYRHVDHPWEALFGFYGIFGFVACVILVLAAKEMRKILMRRKDYYDE